ANALYYRRAGLDAGLRARCDTVLAGALRGGNHLTRTELQAVLAGAGVDVTGQALAYAVMNAELNGVVCSGPRRGRQHTYALLGPVGVDGGPPTAHLLQPYDEYIVGYSESRYAALDVSGAARSNEVVFTAVVVVDGQVAGWWRRTAGKGSVAVEVALFEPP